MKKKLTIIGMVIFLIIANCITVYAGAHSATLQAGKTEVKAGESFTVKIKVSTPDGINGIVTSYSYDSEKLELVDKKVSDSKFTNLGGTSANEIALMFNPEDPSNFTEVTETNIYELTFKVKEGVAAGSTAKITLGQTELSTLATTNYEHTLPGDEITITVAKEECVHSYKVKNDEKQHWYECEKCKETTTKENHNYKDGKCTICKIEEEKKDNTSTPGKDDSVAGGDINYAGIEDYIFILVPAILVLAVILYKKTNQYKGL